MTNADTFESVNSYAVQDTWVHSEDGSKIKLYPMRWLQLVLFCLVSMSNALLWITFAPISNLAQEFYHLDSTFPINSLSLVYMVMYIPMVFPAGLFLDRAIPKIGGGLKWGLMIGIVGSAVSAIVRALTKDEYFWVVWVGQFIGAVVQPFILNAPPMLAANWFPQENRTMATTICSVANPIGVAFGFVIPPLIVHTNSDGEVVGMQRLMVLEAIIVTIVTLISIVLLREKPPTPPSLSAGVEDREESLFNTIKLLVVDLNFWILIISFGCGLGAFNTLATLLNQIVLNANYNNTQAGVLGAAVIIAGLVGSGLIGAIVDKFHCYKLAIVGCFFFATISLICFTLTLAPNRFWVLFVVCVCIGFAMTPVLPLSLELAVEIVYPLREATPSGLLMCSGQIFGIVLIIIMDQLLDLVPPKTEWANGTVCICVCFAFLVMLFFRGKLKRLNLQKDEESQINQ